jgi:hypothetical protein
VGHAVQRSTTDEYLRGVCLEAACTHPITEEGLDSKHRRLREAAAVITKLLFPSSAPKTADAPQVLIAS